MPLATISSTASIPTLSQVDTDMTELMGEKIRLENTDHDGGGVDAELSVCQLVEENEKEESKIDGTLLVDVPRIISKLEACPCCNRLVKQADQTEKRQVVGDTTTAGMISGSTTRVGWVSRHESLFTNREEEDEDYECKADGGDDDPDELDRMMPGVLGKGTPYTVKKVIVQGHLHKKGSGFDWLGSRSWKARWAVLVRARVDGHDVDVPLLQIFWNATSPTPSTVITLDSAVILPETIAETRKSKPNYHPFRFKIRHVKKSVNADPAFQLTRAFSCPQEGRDAWLSAMNEALLEYEKEKASARRLSILSLSPPRRSIENLSLTATGDMAPNSYPLQHGHGLARLSPKLPAIF